MKYTANLQQFLCKNAVYFILIGFPHENAVYFISLVSVVRVIRRSRDILT